MSPAKRGDWGEPAACDGLAGRPVKPRRCRAGRPTVSQARNSYHDSLNGGGGFACPAQAASTSQEGIWAVTHRSPPVPGAAICPGGPGPPRPARAAAVATRSHARKQHRQSVTRIMKILARVITSAAGAPGLHGQAGGTGRREPVSRWIASELAVGGLQHLSPQLGRVGDGVAVAVEGNGDLLLPDGSV